MMFKASVKNKETGEPTLIESEYDSKEDFLNDLKHNGYSVSRVEPKDLFDFVYENTNGNKWDWEIAKKMFKEGKPLTKEEYEKMKDADTKIVNDKSIDAIKDNFTPPGAKGKMARKIRASDNPDWVWDDEDVLKRFMATPYLNGNFSKDMSDEDKAELKKSYQSYKKANIDDLMKSKDFQPFYEYVEEGEEVEPNNYTSKYLWGEDESKNDYANLDKLLDEWDKEDVKDELDTNNNGKIEVDEMADFQKSLDDYAAKNKKGRDDIPVTTRR